MSEAFAKLARARHVDAYLAQCGGEFQVYFTASPVRDYRDAAGCDVASYKLFAEAAIGEGLWLKESSLFHHGVTRSHNDSDFEQITLAFEKGLEAVARRRPT